MPIAADEMIGTLPESKSFARIAMAMELYYIDHKLAGFANGRLLPNTIYILPDGTKHSGAEFVDEKPVPLQQVPHEVILEHYRDTIVQMARKCGGSMSRRST